MQVQQGCVGIGLGWHPMFPSLLLLRAQTQLPHQLEGTSAPEDSVTISLLTS